MTSQTEAQAKTQYIDAPDKIWAYSLKVGSTSIRNNLKQHGFIGQQEALRSLKPVLLHVRHPLDRLVSMWIYFTKCKPRYARSFIRHILEENKDDHDFLFLQGTPLDRWVDVALRYYNPHWVGQVEYHTTEDGVFVPDEVRLVTDIPWHLNVTENKSAWEAYFDKYPALKQQLLEHYAKDVELFKEVTDGRTPTVLRPANGSV